MQLKNYLNKNPLKFLQITMSLLVLAYGIFIAIGSTSALPASLTTSSAMPYLYDKPVGEDGYYMLMVAWNAGEGKGLIGNYEQEVTGIQPLGTFIYAGLAFIVNNLGGNKEDFIRSVIVFGALNFILFALVLARLSVKIIAIRRDSQAIYHWAFILTLSSFFIFRLFLYGLETGIYLTCLALAIYQYHTVLCRVEAGPKLLLSRDIFLLGIIIGIAGLARLDFGVVYAILFFYSVVLNRKLFFPLLVSGLIAAVIVAPWLLHVYFVTGTPVPSSGPAQASLISLSNFWPRLLSIFSAFIQNTSPLIYVNGRPDTLIFNSLIVVFIIYFSYKKSVLKKIGHLKYWALPLVALFFIYAIFFWAEHFYSRYTAPLLLISVPATSVMLVSLSPLMSKIKVLKISTLIFMSAFFVFSFFSLHRGVVGNSHSITAGIIQSKMSDVVVGAFQSGVIGFVNPNVINLDGKVNVDVLPFIRAGNIDEYLETHKEIKIIVDWPSYISKFISNNYLRENWMLCIDGKSWGSVMYCRKDSTLTVSGHS